MPRPRLPFARRRASTAPAAPTQQQAGPVSDSAATPARTQTAEAAAAAQVPQAPEGPAAARPSTDLQERMEGLRAWLAQLDRKLGLRTYVGAAIAVLTLAAAAVALVLVLSLRQDAATEEDVQALRDEISSVEQSASQAADSRVSALEQRLDDLEDEVNRISTAQSTSRRELEVIQDDIRELRADVSGAGSAQGGGASDFQP
jgi:DNA repair exonuclease SbcCD ATPase subunit